MYLLNENFELDKTNVEQQKAFDLVANTNTCLFITGKAGTGKTEFAKTLIKEIGAEGYLVADNNKKNIYRDEYERPRVVEDGKPNSVRNGIFRTLTLCSAQNLQNVLTVPLEQKTNLSSCCWMNFQP